MFISTRKAEGQHGGKVLQGFAQTFGFTVELTGKQGKRSGRVSIMASNGNLQVRRCMQILTRHGSGRSCNELSSIKEIKQSTSKGRRSLGSSRDVQGHRP